MEEKTSSLEITESFVVQKMINEKNEKLKNFGVELKNIGDKVFKKYESLSAQSAFEVNSFFNITVAVQTSLFVLAGSVILFKLLRN